MTKLQLFTLPKLKNTNILSLLNQCSHLCRVKISGLGFFSENNNVESYFITGAANEDTNKLVEQLRGVGYYEVILSIGELEENQIGSNCGQYVRKFITNGTI